MRYPKGLTLFVPSDVAEEIENEMDELRSITGSDITIADLVAVAPAMAKKLYELNALDVATDDRADEVLN